MYLVWRQIAKIYARRKKPVIRYSEKNGVPTETRKSAIEKENDQRRAGIFKLINLTN